MIKERKAKKVVGILILLIVLVSITVGYSVLTTTLNISGTTNITKPNWSVHFGTGTSDIAVTTGSVTTTKPTIVTNSGNLKLQWSVTLSKPGDFYEFTAKIVNDGTINAKLSSFTATTVPSPQSNYISYTVTYDSGTAPAVNDTLNASTNRVLKVRVEFKDINMTQYNSFPTQTSQQTVTLQVGMTYVQA